MKTIEQEVFARTCKAFGITAEEFEAKQAEILPQVEQEVCDAKPEDEKYVAEFMKDYDVESFVKHFVLLREPVVLGELLAEDVIATEDEIWSIVAETRRQKIKAYDSMETTFLLLLEVGKPIKQVSIEAFNKGRPCVNIWGMYYMMHPLSDEEKEDYKKRMELPAS